MLDDDDLCQLTSKLNKLKSLKSLSIGNTNITDRGVACLPKLRRLKWLYISSTQVSDASIDDLAAIPGLTYVSIYNTNISKDGARELRSKSKSLRKVKISLSWPAYLEN